MATTQDKVQKRIDEILQEIRVVLPGTQALLGFQFVAFFNPAFKTLPHSLQVFHLINLLLTTISTILLISPVAFHEIREEGRDTKRWLSITSRLISIAMLALLLGLSGDVFVASYLLSTNVRFVPIMAAAAVFIFGSIMWFGLTLSKRLK